MSVDLAPVAELIGRATRENAELSATAAMWQARAGLLDDQLKQLTATVETPPGATGGAEPGEADDQVASHQDEDVSAPAGFWDLLRRWWGG